MNKKQSGFFALEAIIFIILLIILVVAGLVVFQRHQNINLSEADINKKFGCGRITADFRFTDVFCNNPKFYNNPEAITYEDYYKYQDCDERLKGSPPNEYSKQHDSAYYKAYYDCKDHTKLDSLRVQFIQGLKKLKAESS